LKHEKEWDEVYPKYDNTPLNEIAHYALRELKRARRREAYINEAYPDGLNNKEHTCFAGWEVGYASALVSKAEDLFDIVCDMYSHYYNESYVDELMFELNKEENEKKMKENEQRLSQQEDW
jgi:hypothetical protein